MLWCFVLAIILYCYFFKTKKQKTCSAPYFCSPATTCDQTYIMTCHIHLHLHGIIINLSHFVVCVCFYFSSLNQEIKSMLLFFANHHDQEIRRKLLLNLMLSDVPGISEEEKSKLLHCAVVGGATGVEFSGELSHFIMRDVRQRYADVKYYIHVSLIEANEI
ncbi:internal alternative NAD(P)H-ubiquinone oxidoreductase A1, mitochondrial-like isoform X1 [Mercurialis annua]|uniref:internal alternative NAD(P)H-ubiquinone oxidoreductase A1, mitochondrial-like isoform X1 n=1 Tax=Mercurialis annua TaxID=3986 RepID=UPI00216004E4|nr:internal alternative NAD(P)H-ubiquinone oxidoreductase A1, mitochondrial-like isoform X1 [Mercurialis annua]XP_050233614.1 internal alternative NAD(P)H-ubiquinone oxidoreductase A1, mitochondrial-like isoform X1 [Mercurialis annua]